MSKYVYVTVDSIWTTPDAGKFVPLTPSGCSFMDVLAEKVRRNGYAPARAYAKFMGLEYRCFLNTVQALTGTHPTKWIDALVMRDTEWLLLNTFLTVSEIARRQGYASCTNFSRAWRLRYKMSPEQYRHYNRDVTVRVVREIKLS